VKGVRTLLRISLVFSYCSWAAASAGNPKPAHTGPTPLAVRWTKALNLASLADIDRKLAEPVVIEGGGELVLKHDHQAPCKVTTGREYLDAIAAGYYPLTTYDLTMESWFKRATEPLVLLQKARPAQESFVAAIDLRKDPLSLLPPTLGPWAEGAERRQNEALEAAGKPWKAAYPRTVIEQAKQDRITLVTQGSRTIIEILAWADFDGDGTEDLLLAVNHSATAGSYRSYEFQIVGRKDPKATLRRTSVAR
jgi:hypothetical protein